MQIHFTEVLLRALIDRFPAVVAVEFRAGDADLGAVDVPKAPHPAADGAGSLGRGDGVGPWVRPDPGTRKSGQ